LLSFLNHGWRCDPETSTYVHIFQSKVRFTRLNLFCGLDLDPGKGGACLFGFNNSRRLALNIEQVVGASVAGCQRKLADGHAGAGVEIGRFDVLDGSAGLSQQTIDILAGCLFGVGRHRLSLGLVYSEGIVFLYLDFNQLSPKLSGFSKKNPTRSAADCGM